MISRYACAVAAVVAAGCGRVKSDQAPTDAPVEADAPPTSTDASVDAEVDASTDPAPATGPGSAREPGASCEALRVLLGRTSAVYWVKHPDGQSPPFRVFCEQEINNGGWAMVVNSVGSAEGKTLTFWQMTYPQRLDTRGTPASDQNYYQGSLYLVGTQYMDVAVDLNGKLGILAVMTAKSIDTSTMRFVEPSWVSGLQEVYAEQFAAGWASQDKDLDDDTGNCAVTYGNVAQHYKNCWFYNLGADVGDIPDMGWGPHVNDNILGKLQLALQMSSGGYSRVQRIARFARW